MKKLFTLFLALVASVGTMFADGTKIGDLYYYLNATDQTAEVTYEFGWYVYNYQGLTTANIPASVTYSGTTYSVTSIGEAAFLHCSSLTSVTIPNSVTSIGSSAFSGCSSLTSVTIPNSVTSIGSSAFYNCTGLTSVTVEAGNTVYDSRNNCNAIIETSTNTLIFGCQNTTIPNSVIGIGSSAFAGCSGLTSVIIPNSVTSIGEAAFLYCSSLTSVTIPNSVTSIGISAFYNCSGLTSVTIPNSVTSIGSSAFYGCSSLTSVTIGNSVTSIGDQAFMSCSSLTSVESPALLFNDAFSIFRLSELEMPSQYKHITINAGTLTEEGFDRIRASYRNLESVDLTNTGNTELSDEAFKGCYNLQTLLLPSVLKEIKYMAVAECVKLQAIDIPATVETIGDRAFEDCRSMATVTFAGNAIQYIGCWAFYNCHALQNIVIPEGVTEIGSGAFYGCTYLNNVIVPASVSAIGDNAFALCSKMAKMQVNAVIPPTIAAKTFDEVSRQMPVYVPDLSVATYKSDPLWGQMNIIGISNIVDALDNVESSSAPVKVISDGQLFILLPDGTRYSATGVKVE